jgi:hypothetical protein
VRVADAGRAEELAKQAGKRLLNVLKRPEPQARAETDFDRLEAAAFELERRVLAARDAAKRCGQPAACAGELERLDRHAPAWLGYVHRYRTADPATQVRELQQLLRLPGN